MCSLVQETILQASQKCMFQCKRPSHNVAASVCFSSRQSDNVATNVCLSASGTRNVATSVFFSAGDHLNEPPVEEIRAVTLAMPTLRTTIQHSASLAEIVMSTSEAIRCQKHLAKTDVFLLSGAHGN